MADTVHDRPDAIAGTDNRLGEARLRNRRRRATGATRVDHQRVPVLLSHHAFRKCVAARLETIRRGTPRGWRLRSASAQHSRRARKALPRGLSVSSFCWLSTEEETGTAHRARFPPSWGDRSSLYVKTLPAEERNHSVLIKCDLSLII